MFEIKIDYTPRIEKIFKELEENSHLWAYPEEIADLVYIDVSEDLEKATNYNLDLINEITNKIVKKFYENH